MHFLCTKPELHTANISTYRVYHIEMDETKWLRGIERSIILLNYGAQWLREIWTFEFHPQAFKKVT